jgi:hypothetical protein
LGKSQELPHEAQLAASVCVFTSQPFSAFLSQSAKPAVQVPTAQDPLHTSLALSRSHTTLQPPQLLTLVSRFASQPSLGLLLQFSKPGLQAPMPQLPLVQDAKALAGSGQAFGQAPQWRASVASATSQPSVASLLQSARPWSQVSTLHAPVSHLPLPPGGLQGLSQAPQCSTVLLVLKHCLAQHENPLGHVVLARHPGTQVLASQTVPSGH